MPPTEVLGSRGAVQSDSRGHLVQIARRMCR
jgi:hypothetical protein